MRGDFGLADVFGCHFKGTADHTDRWPNYQNWIQVALNTDPADHPIVDDPQIRNNRRGGDRTEYIGWMTKVELQTGSVQVGRYLSPDKEWPFIVTNPATKGRSIYFASDMGQAYFIAPYHYERRLITNAIRWAAAKPAPYKIEAPMCVQPAFYTQNGGKRTVVHLLNQINSSADGSLPENNPSMREDVIPLHNIKVTAIGSNPAKAYLIPGKTPLPITAGPQGPQVTVPVLETHAMVVFE
jgi:hypothetical protein